MKKQNKLTVDSLLRVPKSNKFGLKIKPIAMPHDDLIKAEKPRRDIAALQIRSARDESSADSPAYLPTYSPTYLSTLGKILTVVTEEDFARLPDSVKRLIDNGMFPNSSLAIYLYLYSLTRGAAQPVRSVRISKTNLLNGANLRAEKALLKNLAHLKNIKLVKITVFNGDHSGNEYEVLTPEEIRGEEAAYQPISQRTYQPTNLPTQNTQMPAAQSSAGMSVEISGNKGPNDSLNSTFKAAEKDEDQACAKFIAALDAISRKLTNKGLKKRDADKWEELGELLAKELEIAAGTNSISDIPAFLTEHLRRRLSGDPNAPEATVKKTLPVGAGSDPKLSETHRAEALTEKAREMPVAAIADTAEDKRIS